MARPRRFLLSRLPDAEPGPETVVRQVFWRLGDGWVLRLRREGPPGVPSRDTLAVRGPGAVEWTLPLDPRPAGGQGGPGQVGPVGPGPAGPGGPGPAGPGGPGPVEAVAALFRAGAGHRVLFSRRRYRLGGRDWDVDEYHWENAGLVLGGTDGPRPPGAVRDVTDEPAYADENLAYAPFTTWAAPSR